MTYPLSYTEKQLKKMTGIYPEYYDHLLSGEELSDFILMLMAKYAEGSSHSAILNDTDTFVTGDFFLENRSKMVSNKLNDQQISEFRHSFEEQTENAFLNADYDISSSRLIRYMPAQWHHSAYFLVYFPMDGMCEVFLSSGEKIKLQKGNLLILSPYTEHATPCLGDDKYLEYFLIRKSSFDKVFWEQLNTVSIMSQFFRTALYPNEQHKTSYLLFDTKEDKEVERLIAQIKDEIRHKRSYASPLINALMSALFCLVLRRYEDDVVLPSSENVRWKKEYSKIFSYIQNNYASATLQDVADAFNYSAKQVGRIVRNYFHMSYKDLITSVKMEKAAALVKDNSMSLEEIAFTLGYHDLSSFCRAFRNFYNTSPVKYRNSH